MKELHQVVKPGLTPIPEEKQGQEAAAWEVWRDSCNAESSNEEKDRRRAVLEALNTGAFTKICMKYTLKGEKREAVGREIGAWRFLGRQMMWNAEEWDRVERRLQDSLDVEGEDEDEEEEEGESDEEDERN